MSNIRSHFQERLEMGFDNKKTNEMGGGGGGRVRREGRGGENYFSVSSAKLLLNLLMEF